MSGETEQNISGWTVDTPPTHVSLREHLEVMMLAEQRFHAERDRRYSEVNVEREKALKIKETADLAALQLAREIQTYKDEKANELREQINRERVLYATGQDVKSLEEKLTTMVAPIAEFVAGDVGRSRGFSSSWSVLVAAIAAIAAIVSIYLVLRGG